MPKISIYISDELQLEMQRYQDINWSRLAAKTFLEAIQNRKALDEQIRLVAQAKNKLSPDELEALRSSFD